MEINISRMTNERHFTFLLLKGYTLPFDLKLFSTGGPNHPSKQETAELPDRHLEQQIVQETSFQWKVTVELIPK